MLSIIIPSINPSFLKNISDNIKQTVGIEYEIISYDNGQHKFGICKVYNICASKAKYNYLVFCHEDILFTTNNWGNILINLLKDKEIGLVGICGAVFKSSAPAPWVSLPSIYYRSNLSNSKYKPSNFNGEYAEVSVIDGCFISCTKENWENNRFNEDLLKGFHLYDIDYSQQFKEKRNIVTYQIEISHFSDGNFDEKWLYDSFEYFKKMKSKFPIYTIEIKKKQIIDLNAYAWKSLFFRMKEMKISKTKLFVAMLNHFILKPFSIDNLRFIKHFI